MKVLVPGIAGFVGKAVLQHLLQSGHEVIAIIRSPNQAKELPSSAQITVVQGDVTNAAEMMRMVPPSFDATIYLPGLLREIPGKGVTFQQVHVEGVRNLLSVAKERGARRWLQMSALGAGRGYSTKYYDTKFEAEQLVNQSGLDWTIFRPSVVFSERYDPKLNFVSELAGVLRKAPIMPVFGDGKYRLQPISLDVLATAMVDSLERPETFGKTYEIGGPEKLEYREILKIIGKAIGKDRPQVHVPFGVMRPIANLFDRFSFFPVTRDQLTMLEHENIVIDPSMEREFDETFTPKRVRFEDGVRSYYSSK